MTEQTQPTDAPLNSIELMKVVMQADEETRAFALRGTTNWAAHIGKAVQNAVLAKWGTPAGAGQPITDSYVQMVPDKCDRIVWRNHYYHLPLTTPQPTQAQAGADAVVEEVANGLRRYGLTLVKTASGYDVLSLRDVAANGIKGADHD